MKLLLEKFFPFIFGLLFSYIWWHTGLSIPENEPLLTATLTVSGIFVGFLATSKAILISMPGQIVEDLRRSGYMVDLVSYIGQAIWINLAFCTLNVLGYFIDETSTWYGLLWILFAVMALSSFIRVTHIMLKIFKYS